MRLSRYCCRQVNNTGSLWKWAGAYDVSHDRDKSFGAPDVQITPLAALIWPSAQTIFLLT